MERESFPTGIAMPSSWAILERDSTASLKHESSSKVPHAAIQLAEIFMLERFVIGTEIRLVISSPMAILKDAAGLISAIFGFSPIASTWPEFPKNDVSAKE